MTNKKNVTHVSILDKEYQVACPPEEKDALHRAANELDVRMRAIRSSGAIIGLERIAVMAALNLCHELLQNKSANLSSPIDQETLERITKKIDSALN